MVVMTPRETWTDERLDDFKENVNQRFDLVDKRFDQVERRMAEGFSHMDNDIRELRRTMNQGFFFLGGAMLTGFLTLAGLIVF